MNRLHPTPDDTVTTYPSLHYRCLTGIGPRQDGSDYLVDFDVRIVGNGGPDSPGEIPLGDLQATLIRLGRAYEEGFDRFTVFDQRPDVLELASELFGPGFQMFKDTIEDAFPEACPYEDILFIRRLVVNPVARGHRVGVSALHRFMTDWENGCSLIAVRALPMQFLPGICTEPDWENQSLASFPADRKDALGKLENHFRGLGFKRFGTRPWMGLCPKLVQAPLQELAISDALTLSREQFEEALS